jgi:hypothetical protein
MLTILAWYGRPSTSHHNFHFKRLEVLAYVQQCHRSNQIVLLLGDFNMSYNLPTHRLNTSTNSTATQDDALHTWSSTTTWSSSDHITILTNTPLTTHSPYRDITPWEARLSDHALRAVTITSFGKVHNSRRRTPFPRFRKDKEKEYAERVASLLDNSPPHPSPSQKLVFPHI